jgi:serine/threonine protein kinase
LEEVEDLGLCIVSEWIEGVTLSEWLKSKQNIGARRRVFMQILDALEYIHSKVALSVGVISIII